MKKILFILSLLLAMNLSSQTVVPMLNPEDADLILLQVYDSTQADVRIYRTTERHLFGLWDNCWRFRKMGFANFSVFIAKDTTELWSIPYDVEETDTAAIKYFHFYGKVYFTKNIEFRGYKREDFGLPGVMRVKHHDIYIPKRKREKIK